MVVFPAKSFAKRYPLVIHDVSHANSAENDFVSKMAQGFIARHYLGKADQELTPGEVILGTIINEGETKSQEWRLIDKVNENDFPLPTEKRLYKTLKLLFEENGEDGISLLTVSLRLQIDQDPYWKPSAIVRIAAPEMGFLPAAHNMHVYIDAMRNICMAAKIIESSELLLMSLNQNPHANPLPTLDAHAEVVNELLLGSSKTKDEVIWSDEFWSDYIDDLEKRIDFPGGNGERIHIGIEVFDKVLPMSKGNLVILAGRPGVGKTSSLLFFIENITKANQDCIGLVISLEMSMREIGDKRLAAAGSVDVMKFKSPENLSEDDLDRVVAAIKQIQEREKDRLAYIDKSTFKISDIRREIRRIKKEKGKLDWLAIDYLGLIKYEGKAQDLYHKITAISGDLKRMAREENVLIISLAQLNRDSAKMNMKPEMKDLRDSGAIEQDADAIIFVHRDNYYKGEKILKEKGGHKTTNPFSGVGQEIDDMTYLCIRKNRHGIEQRMDIPFIYNSDYGRMSPVTIEK